MIRKRDGVSPVIAVILMLAITVVLAAVAWLMISGMMANLEVPPTTVSLTEETTTIIPGERVIYVGGVDRTYGLHNFEAVLIIDNYIDMTSQMDPLGNMTIGNITYLDLNGDSKLTQGDQFVISVDPNTTYELKLFWKQSGNQVTRIIWNE